MKNYKTNYYYKTNSHYRINSHNQITTNSNPINFFSYLIKIKTARPELITGAILNSILKITKLLEKSPGGPYYNEKGELDKKLNRLIFKFWLLFNVRLEPLEKFLQAKNNIAIASPTTDPSQSSNLSQSNNFTAANIKIYNQIATQAKNNFQTWGPELRPLALLALKKILTRDRDRQILLLPLMFLKSLDQNKLPSLATNRRLPLETIKKLGLANLYLWLAYTIYDDFLDSAGQTANLSITNLSITNLPTANLPITNLSIANLAFKEFVVIFQEIIADHSSAQKIFNETLLTMEKANAWEIKNRGINANMNNLAETNINNFAQKNFKYLADKSLAHILGPLIILNLGGCSATSLTFKKILIGWKNYLSARQLSDDAHDWEADLRAGYFNNVSVQIFQTLTVADRQDLKKLSATSRYLRLRQIFWEKIFTKVNQQILHHLKIARKAFASLAIISRPEYLINFFEPLKRQAQKSLDDQNLFKELLKSQQNKIASPN